MILINADHNACTIDPSKDITTQTSFSNLLKPTMFYSTIW